MYIYESIYICVYVCVCVCIHKISLLKKKSTSLSLMVIIITRMRISYPLRKTWPWEVTCPQ